MTIKGRRQFDRPSTPTRTFIAKYRGPCQGCSHQIQVGDEAIFGLNNEVMHAQCPEDDSLKSFGPVCKTTGCLYENMQHAGDCNV